MSKDRVEINLDDEEPLPGDSAPSQAPNASAWETDPPGGGERAAMSRLVITAEDLADIPEPPIASRRPPGLAGNPEAKNSGGFAKPMEGMPWAAGMPYGVRQGSGIAGATLLRAVLIGVSAGVVAWAVAEPIEQGQMNFLPGHEPSAGELLRDTAIWMAIIGGVMGCWLGAAEKVLDRLWEKAGKGALIGAGIGAAGGMVAGLCGQFVFHGILGSTDNPNIGLVFFARILGWMLVGLFTGLAQGAGRGGGQRLLNGLIGGAVGGAIGGLLFDPIGYLTGGDILSRGAGIVVMGAATGWGISLVDEIRKEAWLSVMEGPLAGKQFILFEKQIRLGASPKCEITLVKDPNILPEHAIIEDQGRGRHLRATRPDVPPFVNGQPVHGVRLDSGMVITLGSTHLLYEEKPMAGKAV